MQSAPALSSMHVKCASVAVWKRGHCREPIVMAVSCEPTADLSWTLAAALLPPAAPPPMLKAPQTRHHLVPENLVFTSLPSVVESRTAAVLAPNTLVSSLSQVSMKDTLLAFGRTILAPFTSGVQGMGHSARKLTVHRQWTPAAALPPPAALPMLTTPPAQRHSGVSSLGLISVPYVKACYYLASILHVTQHFS